MNAKQLESIAASVFTHTNRDQSIIHLPLYDKQGILVYSIAFKYHEGNLDWVGDIPHWAMLDIVKHFKKQKDEYEQPQPAA